MIVKVDGNAVAAIEAILKRGNNAIVRRKGDGVVVMEEKRNLVATNGCVSVIAEMRV